MRKLGEIIVMVPVWTAGVAVLGGCGATFPSLEAPPQLLNVSGNPPQPPASREQDVKEVLVFPTKSEVVSARPPPNFKQHSIGLGAIDYASAEASESSPMSSLLGLTNLLTKGKLGMEMAPVAQVSARAGTGAGNQIPPRVSDLLISRLVKRGVSRIVDLSAAGRGVAVSIDQEKGSSMAGGKGSTRWMGMLDKMVFVGKVSDAEYILYGEIASMGTVAQTVELRSSYAKEEMTRYAAIYAGWRQQTENRLATNVRTYDNYTSKYNQARDAYVKDGGKFPPSADESNKPVATHLAEYTAFSNSAATLIAADKRALSETPDPGMLEEQARAKKKKVDVNFASLSMVLKLIEANSNEIIWMQTISKSDETLAGCFDAVLDKVVDELLTVTQ
jgi:hypothetical protein